MHLLYLDASGSAKSATERHFVLAGVCVFERGIYHLIQELDTVVGRYAADDDPDLELHGSPVLGGRAGWGHVDPTKRADVIRDALSVCVGPSRANVRLFGVVIQKIALDGENPVEYAFEQIADRFNKFLQRKFAEKASPQRGLMIMDESGYEQRFQGLAKNFRAAGSRWGKLRNLAEVPMFADSKASRLIQLADLVAYALWRRYEHGDLRFMTTIGAAFDQVGGVYHGLLHHKAPSEPCNCLACESRKAPIRPARLREHK